MDISPSPFNYPLLDSHIHLFRGGYAEKYGAGWANQNEVALYEALRQVHNIERALVVGYEGAPQFNGNNQDILELAQEHQWITPLQFIDADNPPQPSPVSDERANTFAGISLYIGTADEAASLHKWSADILNWMNGSHHIVSLNATPEAIPSLTSFVERLPDCYFLISHLGLPGSYKVAPSGEVARQRLEPLLKLSSLSNVGVKVSAFYAVSEPTHDYPHRSAHPFLYQLRESFGAERLFWGSDFSPALEHVSFAQTIDVVSHLGWPADEMEAIMGANLRRVIAARS